MQQLVD